MNSDLIAAINASIQAGKKILEIYNQDFEVEYKADESPLTAADKASDMVIKSFLENSYPILSEEGKSIPFEERKNWTKFWLVDPLDGTKEFIKKNGEFTVNIALIEEKLPVLGVVFQPVTAMLYFGSKDLGGFACQLDDLESDYSLDQIMLKSEALANRRFPETYTIVASRSHMSKETEDFIEGCRKKYKDINLVSKGSSIKLCLIAERKAHIYPRIAPTMEWDTAAAHAVVKFAGGDVLNYHTQEELIYNKQDLLNPHFIVVGR